MNIISTISRMFDGLSNNSFLGKSAITIGALTTAYFTPIVGLLITCFTCSIVDMYYGIKVAKRQEKKITSRKNWKGTLLKIRDEFVLILLAHMIEFNILNDSSVFVLSGGITVIIALTELWSILENLNTINPDGPWKALGKFLKKKGEDYVGIRLDEYGKNGTKHTKRSDKV